jgi:hypothetical protein
MRDEPSNPEKLSVVERLAKPLFWRKPTDHPQDRESASWVANGIGGQYSIEPQRDGTFLLWWAHDNFIWEKCETIKEAKAKADADWQKRFAERMAEPSPCSVENGGWLGPQLAAKAPILSLQERLDKLEADLVRVNGIIFGHGAPLGSEQYFEIRKICAAYERARSALSPQTREGDK